MRRLQALMGTRQNSTKQHGRLWALRYQQRFVIFANGRMLKQINATLINLLPKVHMPCKVSKYRPIACCNVMYKIISRILVARMKGILDRLVDINQNAFVPGRKISDNILLSQELLAGYNQRRLSPRCAFKVDLGKAYDSVEWNFLVAVLRLFRFPSKFIGWI
ncbi:UNVERIFIED_CONTAM: hypothetical protein Sradi_6241100 [Sesamum radiatum]|uniref:Reverse transcriptase domain-containing protein n=1 Tax=Sesamum radiatum TaxID=300843 RepID=A0AAW2KD75_SESRA